MLVSQGGTVRGRCDAVIIAVAALAALLCISVLSVGSADAEGEQGGTTEIVIEVIGGNEKHLFGSGDCDFIYQVSSDNPLFDKGKVMFTKPDIDINGVGTFPMGLTPADFSYNDDSVSVRFEVVDGSITCIDAEDYYNTVNLWMFGDTDTVSISATKLTSANLESRGMKISNRIAHVVFSPEVVAYLSSLGTDVTFSMTSGDNLDNVVAAKLSAESTPICLRLSVNGTPLSTLGGMVTVYVPHEIAYKEDVENVSAVFIDAVGNCSNVEDVCYDDGVVIFCTDHFSEFAVVPDIEPKGYMISVATMLVVAIAIFCIMAYLVRLRSKDKRVRVPVD